jgi:hypothetical protein
VAMTADQTIGISAGRAMVIETKTAPNNNRVRVAIEIILTVDLSNKDLVDHSNNRVKDQHKKIVDLGKDKDLAGRNKVRVKVLVGHSKTVDHSRDKEDKDPADQDRSSLILDSQMHQRRSLLLQRIRLLRSQN